MASSAGAMLVTQIEPAAAPAALDSATQDRLRAIWTRSFLSKETCHPASEAGGLTYFSALKQTEPAYAAEILTVLGKSAIPLRPWKP